jgi:hypothetical protein
VSTIIDLLDRPDDSPGVIEDYLIGPDLPTLVAELEERRGGTAPPAPLPEAIVARILSGGLAALTDEEFATLLAAPRTLLDVQKLVLLHGGDYWDGLMRRRETLVPAMPAVPKSRSPRLWASAALAGLAASVALVLVEHARFGEAERRLNDQLTRTEALTREVAALRQAHPLVLPADLPELEVAAQRPADPADLPEGDPGDLPG